MWNLWLCLIYFKYFLYIDVLLSLNIKKANKVLAFLICLTLDKIGKCEDTRIEAMSKLKK
jgi:hypothetical protein